MSNQTEWTLSEAAEVLCRVQRRLNHMGFFAALYGSVLTGDGRDIDIVVCATRSVTARDVQGVATLIADCVKGRVVQCEESPITTVVSFAIVSEDFRLVDVQVRPIHFRDKQSQDAFRRREALRSTAPLHIGEPPAPNIDEITDWLDVDASLTPRL